MNAVTTCRYCGTTSLSPCRNEEDRIYCGLNKQVFSDPGDYGPVGVCIPTTTPTPKDNVNHPKKFSSDGGSTAYYYLPDNAKELNDLIEFKKMDFALGNIFKACYRFGEKDTASQLYDLNKIIYFAERKKAQLTR